MSTEVLIRGFFAFIIALIFGYSAFSKQEREKLPSEANDDQLRYLPYVGTLILPIYLTMLYTYSVIKVGPDTTTEHLPALCFDVFLHISIYYLLLLLALPYLHKFINARACAELWMLPNFLYIIHSGFMALPKPLMILRIPPAIVTIFLYVWLSGFLVIMLWKILSHFRFRHHILHQAYPVTDPSILVIWHREQSAAGYKKNPSCLVYSPNVKTPLSIGFTTRSTRVVLPERKYTPEELALVFRHEIIHIGRGDSSSKFFLTFCTAMCWFNPLMWIANRRCSDDLELSCDETVLLNAKADTRRQYAELLLSTAGDDRGFTTCLSNSAEALKYRLKNVIHPVQKLSGCVLIGVTFFLLIMSFGYISVSFDEANGREYIFQNADLKEYPIKNISRIETDGLHYYDCTDENALREYLAELPFCKITGNYTFPEDTDNIGILFNGPEGIFSVNLNDDVLKVTPLHGEELFSEIYYCTEEIDWEYLYSLISSE